MVIERRYLVNLGQRQAELMGKRGQEHVGRRFQAGRIFRTNDSLEEILQAEEVQQLQREGPELVAANCQTQAMLS